jgi:hypothetical protein
MKKQKKVSALVASLASVLIAATTLGGATFAWFTRGTQASASGFDFTASAASGIRVSTDAFDWKSSITAGDFDLSGGSVQENSRLTISGMEPVSTVAENVASTYSFYSATSGDGNFTLAADTSNYLVFDLYFLNQGAEDLTLSLTDSSFVIDGLNDQDASLSTRVGFIVQGSNNEASVVTGLSGNVSSYIWEPNSTQRSASALAGGAVPNAKYEYNGVSGDNGSVPVSTLDAYGMLSYNAAYTTPVTSTNDIEIGDSPVIATLPGAAGGQITKIKVFIWMEGQDVDCTNAASEGDVTISLAFDSGAAVTALGAKTAASFSTVDNTTTLAITGTGNLGATYNAYVFRTVTDGNVSLDYRLYLSTGAVLYDTVDITDIVLGTEVSSVETYEVVVTATLTGAIGSRTSTPVSIT